MRYACLSFVYYPDSSTCKHFSLNAQTLTWDGWGRLSGVGGNVSFAYDSAGRRIRKTANGITTYYLYDGSTLIAELDQTGTLKRFYTWGAVGLISDLC